MYSFFSLIFILLKSIVIVNGETNLEDGMGHSDINVSDSLFAEPKLVQIG